SQTPNAAGLERPLPQNVARLSQLRRIGSVVLPMAVAAAMATSAFASRPVWLFTMPCSALTSSSSQARRLPACRSGQDAEWPDWQRDLSSAQREDRFGVSQEREDFVGEADYDKLFGEKKKDGKFDPTQVKDFRYAYNERVATTEML
ncbi:unnamed protein product, partial [Polarella glacialis]